MKTKIHFLLYLAYFFLGREMFQKNVVEKNKTNILYLVTFFFEYRAVCEIMWEKFVKWGSPQMAIWRGACVLHARYLRLHTHTQNL
jgi:hypothetical protein